MFKLKTKKDGKEIVLKISGMHCPSCGMNIDGALEELDGVLESTTNYTKQTTKVIYNPQIVTLEKMTAEIKKSGYTIQQ
ncbi:MAG: heavy-metal-associated domain-containing protein [Patescibacteria group bacterium]|jgi:Cu+-exporting ATPase